MEVTVHCDCCNTDKTVDADDPEHYSWKCEGCGRTYRTDIEHVEIKSKKIRPELGERDQYAKFAYSGLNKIKRDYEG